MKRVLIFKLVLIFAVLGFTSFSVAQIQNIEVKDANETILNLMEDIFAKIPADLAEIDPQLKRIAVYRLDVEGARIPTPLKVHFENRIMEIFRQLEQPAVVSLPEMNTLKISSTDSSFSVINSLPSPDELWKVGRRLRVDGFIEGNLTYIENKALFLDLRLNRTGTNEILWVKSYSAYEKKFKPTVTNPLIKTFNAGLEVFNVDFESPADSLLGSDFKNRLIQYSIYVGLYQYLSVNSRFRYEFRAGLSFQSEGVSLTDTQFDGEAFYGIKPGSSSLTKPISYNFNALLYSTLIRSKNNTSGDWLAFYFNITRYFTLNMPDLTGIGLGFRSDLSSKFSISAGVSTILGSKFSTHPVESTGEPLRMKVASPHFEIFLLQFLF